MDKAEILRRVQEGWSALDVRVKAMRGSEFDRETNPSGWTAKDTLAHITAWEKRMLTWLLAASRCEAPAIPEPGATWDDLDRINTLALELGRSLSSEQVRADAQMVHQQLLEAIRALPEDPSPENWRFWLNQEPPWKLIAANTYEHYAHHLTALP